MKGILSEYLMKLLTLIILTAAILGVTLSSAQFEGFVLVNEHDKLTAALAHSLFSASCLVESVDGERRESVFEERKLDEMTEDNFCIRIAETEFAIKIIEGSNEWTLGDIEAFAERYPVAIKYSEDDIRPGELLVSIER